MAEYSRKKKKREVRESDSYNEEIPKEKYNPSQDEQDDIADVYDEFRTIDTDVMKATYKEFNDRTLSQFLDDSQKRANGFVLPKDAQGKEEWQANIFTGSTRNKVRSYVGSVTKEPPPIRIRATNASNDQSVFRADVMKNLLRHSYVAYDNPERVIFEDGWNCAINGTVIKYDGYLKTKDKVKIIDSFDPLTGEVVSHEVDAIIEDRPIELNIEVNRFYVKNPYLSLQAQPLIIWVQYYDKKDFDYEFAQNPKAKYVPCAKSGSGKTYGESDVFFGDQWLKRVSDKQIEVLRYYCKRDDCYKIVANGVLLLKTPMLWGKKRKVYPFALSVFEPFANSSLIWGNSLPNVLMWNQDAENALYNSALDRQYRSLQRPLIIGTANKDAFDLEDEYVTGDSKIYVNDVTQIREIPIEGATASDFNMLKMVANQLALGSLDAVQQGVSGSGATAREIVIANEKANEVKGIFFMMLKDLWIQKYRIRSTNLLMNYNRPSELTKIVGEDGKEEFFKQYNIPNSELSSGEQGTLQIQLTSNRNRITAANKVVGYDKENRPINDLAVQEEMERVKTGQAVEIMIVPSDYLDEWEFDFEIVSDSLHQKTRSLDMALGTEKITTVAQLFPEIFMANKQKFFSEYMRLHDDSPDKYLEAAQMPASPLEAMMGAAGGQTPQPQISSQIAAPTRQLGQLSELSTG